MSLLERKQLRGTDELWTPPHALAPLLPFLPARIWECAAGSGKLAESLRKAGHSVVEGHSFFTDDFSDQTDAIVSNPPYSKKDPFLSKCYHSGLPFALLLPITALEGIKRQKLYRKYGLEVLFLDRRVDFTGKGAPWFAVAWFTRGLEIKSEEYLVMRT
jgi:hypothetical protein